MRSNPREVLETAPAATAGPRRLLTAAAEEGDYPAGRPPAAQEDWELADGLLALPRAEGRLAVESDPSYHRLGLARLFVMAAEVALLADRATDAEPAAELAVAVALQLPSDGGGQVRRTAALGQWLLGKALLRGRSWAQAARAFEVMYAHLPDQAPSAERGLAAYGLAQLYADLESLDAATGMGMLAARQFSLLGATAPAAACHAQAGLLLQESGDLEAAATQLMVALRVLVKDPALAPSLSARLLLALAWVETTMGRDDDARRRVQSARLLYPLAPSRAESVERGWREALALAAAGRAAAAERGLDRVRRRLLEAGSLAEATRATVDHAELRIGAGRGDSVGKLAAALAGAFPGEGESWAQEIAGLARLAGAGRSNERYLARQELGVSLRLEAPATPRRPALIAPWRSLTDRLLRGHAESPEASGAVGGT